MLISIVVPAFNEERLLRSTLESIKASAIAFAAWELVVCDNNSTDRTAEIARQAGATVVFEKKNQISRARNAGAAAARGDWLVFVDADSHPSRELFAEVREAIARGDCLAGGATVELDTPEPWVRAAVGAWNLVSRTARWAAGSFVFCEASAFREAGGFSEELYASEEIDLFRRLKRLARARRKRILILHRHPLRTSGRKARLYSWREHLGFLFRYLRSPRRSVRSAEQCALWYDGRR